MELFIKNMVCDRCIYAVRSVLNETGIEPLSVELGKAVLAEEPGGQTLSQVGAMLEKLGFELIRDKRSGVIEQIKGLVIEYISGELEGKPKENLSDYLARALQMDYKMLSTLFSGSEGQTIGQYYAHVKIEKVKELIDYDEMSLSQISDTFNYSSPSHLTKQFKKITGITPKAYKNNKTKRVALDKF